MNNEFQNSSDLESNSSHAGQPDSSFEQEPLDAQQCNDFYSPQIAANPTYCTQCGQLIDSQILRCQKCSLEPGKHSSSGAVGYGFEVISIRSSLWLYFCLLAGFVVGFIAYSMDMITEMQLDFYGTGWFVIVTLLWVLMHYRLVANGLRSFGSIKWYIISVLMGFATFGIATFYLWEAGNLFGLENLRYSDSYLQEGYGWGIIFLLVVVEPAIFEELAFRGVMFGSMGKILKNRDVILVTALMFMMLHLNIVCFPFLFIIGLCLGYLRLKSQSLYPCMLMHFIHNLMVIMNEAGLGG